MDDFLMAKDDFEHYAWTWFPGTKTMPKTF